MTIPHHHETVIRLTKPRNKPERLPSVTEVLAAADLPPCHPEIGEILEDLASPVLPEPPTAPHQAPIQVPDTPPEPSQAAWTDTPTASESPVVAALRWWDAVRSAPALPDGYAIATPPRPQKDLHQADLFPQPPAKHVLSAADAQEIHLTDGVRLIALALAQFGSPSVTIDPTDDALTRIGLFDKRKMTLRTIRQSLRVLLARGFLRVEHGGRGRANTYTLVTAEVRSTVQAGHGPREIGK